MPKLAFLSFVVLAVLLLAAGKWIVDAAKGITRRPRRNRPLAPRRPRFA